MKETKNKKGIELPMNVIIIATISLVVLVVLIFLIRNSAEGVVKQDSCENLGGICKEKCDLSSGEGPITAFGCKKDELCCKKVKF